MIESDVIILGAGAAGLLCASRAGHRVRHVIVLERNERIGEKIRISGGGRCNFTNVEIRPDQFLSSNPGFFRSPLARFTQHDVIALVEQHGIEYFEKPPGQLFCKKSATEFIDLLVAECNTAHVEIITGCDVQAARLEDGKFHVRAANNQEYISSALVVATGGLSIPKIGATDVGYRIAKSFGIAITPLRPGLVPLTLAPEDLHFLEPLRGVSLNVEVQCNDGLFQAGMLFTHRGLSGPAILQISSYWREGDELVIDLAPGIDVDELLQREYPPGRTVASIIASVLPNRFAKAFCDMINAPRTISNCSARERVRVVETIHAWKIKPVGTEGYEKAEVTLGGIDTRELSSKTMEAKRVPGLYFIGEVVDVTGWLGGYNFQWAWSSAVAAGDVV